MTHGLITKTLTHLTCYRTSIFPPRVDDKMYKRPTQPLNNSPVLFHYRQLLLHTIMPRIPSTLSRVSSRSSRRTPSPTDSVIEDSMRWSVSVNDARRIRSIRTAEGLFELGTGIAPRTDTPFPREKRHYHCGPTLGYVGLAPTHLPPFAAIAARVPVPIPILPSSLPYSRARRPSSPGSNQRGYPRTRYTPHSDTSPTPHA
jgi:hypothetical protein